MTLETPGLGDRSYVAHDGIAMVVDPQRDIDRVLGLAAGAACAHPRGQTHLHNDYVTGGLELARATGRPTSSAAERSATSATVADDDVDRRRDARPYGGHPRAHAPPRPTCCADG